jgi:hypothetical protein
MAKTDAFKFQDNTGLAHFLEQESERKKTSIENAVDDLPTVIRNVFGNTVSR